ncbi:hypothetical protein B0H13DRAFT_2458302 [Mycena leptocephala]|nr:hypothetical protein B0H13DRAFT_2458302 [Mycena leptocephala]
MSSRFCVVGTLAVVGPSGLTLLPALRSNLCPVPDNQARHYPITNAGAYSCTMQDAGVVKDDYLPSSPPTL